MSSILGKNGQKGFLLIEVLVATVIISVALVALGGMFIQATRANSQASQITTATNLAQEQLDLLKSWTKEDWVAYAPLVIPWKGTGTSPVLQNNVNYTVTTVVEACTEDNIHLVQVKVTVSWPQGGNGIVMTAFYPKS